jgi:hypothetical protein
MLHSSRGGATVSVKGGCIEGLDWKGAVHIWTKRAVLQVPEGAEAWEGEPEEGKCEAWRETAEAKNGDGKIAESYKGDVQT